MTKESILHSALHLFSQKGYAGTSIRDIASAVGIKESSIYAHFASKEDIFRGVIEHYDYMQQLRVDLNEVKKDPFKIIEENVEFFINSHDNADNIAYCKLTQMEMLKEGPARELVRAESFDKMEEYFESLLLMLMDEGILKKTDKKLILSEFIGPFYYLHMKVISGWLKDGEKDEIIATMRKHLTYFLTSFKKDNR